MWHLSGDSSSILDGADQGTSNADPANLQRVFRKRVKIT
jgi:hypothetical protein